MILKQYYLGCLAQASYLIADQRSGHAVVVDPRRDIDQYVEDATGLGCRIQDVFLTHLHADFLAGHLELRERTRATIRLGARAQAEYEFEAMGEGASLPVGSARIQVLETPGHSPESISLLVFDPEYSLEAPYAVLTGDTLFIGDVGRPDLRAALGWTAEKLASLLYDSVHEKLLTLPDETLVYPGHGAGSLCGRSLSNETVSTIGAQRAYNHALAPMSRERFVELVSTDLPDAPAYFTYDAVLNTRERPTLRQALSNELRPLEITELLELAGGGGQLLDTRPAEAFQAGHLPGALNIGLDGSYATWCGTLLSPERPIVLVTEPGKEEESAMRLGRIGFDNVAGFLSADRVARAAAVGGTAGVAGAGLRRIERISARELAERLRSDAPPTVIDVRNRGERAEKWIDPSLNLPLAQLNDHTEELSAGGLVVLCATGYRSAIAASLLERAGRADVSDLVGGLAAWEAAELPVVAAVPA
jgi:hydroxyacylglutathione hydrolase